MLKRGSVMLSVVVVPSFVLNVHKHCLHSFVCCAEHKIMKVLCVNCP